MFTLLMEPTDQPSQRQTIETLLLVIEEQRAIIEAQRKEIAALPARVAELERQAGLNSSNSGKPPLGDGLKRPPRTGSLRERFRMPAQAGPLNMRHGPAFENVR